MIGTPILPAMGRSPAKALLEDLDALRQKRIQMCGNAVLAELAEAMPEWQATKITAAIERLIEAYMDRKP